MTYGVAAAKLQVVYNADNGDSYLYNKTADQISAGFWNTGTGTPHPGKSFKPRHVTGRSTDGKKLHLAIATRAAYDGISLGDALSLGGKSFTITGKHGEQSSG